MAPLTLPLSYSDIERILPHRYPFLLVDRIVEFEVDKRVVGIKNVSLNDPYLSQEGALGVMRFALGDVPEAPSERS